MTILALIGFLLPVLLAFVWWHIPAIDRVMELLRARRRGLTAYHSAWNRSMRKRTILKERQADDYRTV